MISRRRWLFFHLDVPVEFVNLCDEYRLTPEEVLRGFIADACGLQNYFVRPRADGYSSNGSDERSMAYDYLERAHAMKRSEYDTYSCSRERSLPQATALSSRARMV